MGQDPAAIRREIEQTREHMGDTVDALGYKADVPSRAKESVSDKVDSLKSRIGGIGSQVSDATPDAGEVKQGARQAVGIATENPLGLAIGAAAVGFLAGTLVPSTRVEDERLGPVADQVKEQAKQTGQEALEQGKQVVRETAETASEKAQEALGEVKDRAQQSAQEHAQQVGDSAKDSVEQVQCSASASARD
jgi:gas vesicle protein